MSWEDKISEWSCCLCGREALYNYCSNALCEDHISMQYGYKVYDDVFEKNFKNIQRGVKIVSKSKK